MSKIQIPIYHKYCMTIEEAAAYFSIGENRLRKLISENQNANFVLWIGNNAKIKRQAFEKLIDGLSYI